MFTSHVQNRVIIEYNCFKTDKLTTKDSLLRSVFINPHYESYIIKKTTSRFFRITRQTE